MKEKANSARGSGRFHYSKVPPRGAVLTEFNQIEPKPTKQNPSTVYIDKDLKFDDHINNILKKANDKFYALLGVSKFMSHNKLRLLLKTFI